MAIGEPDTKLLWGRAAGICSNPACRDDLTRLLETGDGFHVGEMAHVIAHSEQGPRGQAGGGSDAYANLILLCPTCHRTVDKAPEGTFPVEMLLRWKSDHEREIRNRGVALKFGSIGELKAYVSRKLRENKAIYDEFGPHSEVAQRDPLSNLVEVWALRKLSTMVPNNIAIINAVEGNIELIERPAEQAFLRFKNHATAWEQNQYGRLDSYPLFPTEFEREFSDG